MAPHDILYQLHRVRVVRSNVEAPTASHLGRHLRYRLGHSRHLSGSSDILGRYDGRALLPRRF